MKKFVFGSLLVAGMAIGGIFLMGGNTAKASDQLMDSMALQQCPCPSYCSGGWMPESLCDGGCSTVKCAVRPLCSGCTP